MRRDSRSVLASQPTYWSIPKRLVPRQPRRGCGRVRAERLEDRRLLSASSALLSAATSFIGPRPPEGGLVVALTPAATPPPAPDAAAPDGDIVGTPVTGQPGITMSVADLMTRDHARDDHPSSTDHPGNPHDVEDGEGEALQPRYSYRQNVNGPAAGNDSNPTQTEVSPLS